MNRKIIRFFKTICFFKRSIFLNFNPEKIIDNRIIIHFKDMSKDKVVVEVKELMYNLLGKLSKISFTEKWSSG